MDRSILIYEERTLAVNKVNEYLRKYVYPYVGSYRSIKQANIHWNSHLNLIKDKVFNECNPCVKPHVVYWVNMYFNY